VLFIISLLVAAAVAIVAHGSSRRFVRTRLRYVDDVQRGVVPWMAGGAAFLLGAMIVPLLPVVGLGTAITLGLAVGTGVAAGVRDIRRGTLPVPYGG
jgi:hypothetical protein